VNVWRVIATMHTIFVIAVCRAKKPAIRPVTPPHPLFQRKFLGSDCVLHSAERRSLRAVLIHRHRAGLVPVLPSPRSLLPSFFGYNSDGGDKAYSDDYRDACSIARNRFGYGLRQHAAKTALTDPNWIVSPSFNSASVTKLPLICVPFVESKSFSE
jgi:hypothetical protein